MTVGIYLLKFNGTDKVYVGQSLRIEQRFAKHKYRLANNIANPKLQEAYATYGMPYIEVFLECDIEEDLDEYENEAIELFNSVNNGFNIRSKAGGGGKGAQGVLHPGSKYSETQLISVFRQLLAYNSIFSEIEKNTGVLVHTIRDISKGKAHRWLRERYPDDYDILISLKDNREKNTSKAQGKYFTLISPIGEEIVVDNISEFSRINGLNKSHISGVLNGIRKSHLGWKLKNE